MVRIQRRRLLQFAVGGLAGAASGQRHRTRNNTSETELSDIHDFDPAAHGLGFSNWSGDTGEDANGEEFSYEPSDVTLEYVRRVIDDSWTTALSAAEKSLMTRIVYSWIGSEAATNGHCYGMVYAAEGYFRNTWELPSGVDDASEIPRPTDLYQAVGDRIRWLQTSQLLHAELTWYALFGLRWGLADHRESLRQLTASIDATGTCGLAIEGEAGAHQVLAHGYEERSDGVVDVSVYDPNYEAAFYADSDSDDLWTLSVDSGSGDIREIKDGYDDFLYHDPEMDHTVVERLIGGQNRVIEMLSNAVFLGLESGEVLQIDVPDEVLVDRPVAEYADPDRKPYADAAVVFGPPDEFEVSVDGANGEEYSLNTLGLRDGELVLEERVSGTLVEVPARLRFRINDAGEFVVNAVEEGAEEAVNQTEEAVNQTEEAANQTEEAVNQTEEAANKTEGAVNKTEETAEQAENVTTESSADDLGGTNDWTDWLTDNWWVAAISGGLGLGATYRYLARRFNDEKET